MAGFGGAVKLTGESEYRKALGQITQSLREVSADMKLVAAQYDKNDTSTAALTARSEALARKYDAEAQKVDVLKSNYAALDAQYQKNIAKHDALKTALDAEQQKLTQIAAETGTASDEYKAQAAVVADLAQEYTKSSANIEQNERALSNARVELTNASAAMQTTGNQLNTLASALDDSADSADEMGSSVQDSGNKAEAAANGGFTVFKSVLADLASNAIQAVLSGLAQMGRGLIDVGRQAIESYADYEQLVGGVETLFGAGGMSIEKYAASVGKTVDEVRGEYDNLMQAQTDVLNNAANAFQTAGMNQNEYMETVTTVSAALISSLEGDTVAAAAAADQAIIDMSDNANKMGTDIESIQQAYLGFSRGQYQLLDNLKLGYGGTREEMERLIADASEFSGIEYDIDNLNDVYDAIHVIQTEMGITGTTSREAASTISGSAQMMSAAWQNLLTGMADDNADFGALVDNLIDSVMAFANNIIPRIQTTIQGMATVAGSLLQELVPQLVEMIPPILTETLPILIDAVQSVIQSVLDVLPQIMPVISALIPQIVTSLVSMLPQIVNAGIQILLSLINGISATIPQLLAMLPTIITETVTTLINNLPAIIETGINLLTSLIEGIVAAIPTLVDMIPTIITTFITVMVNNLPQIINTGINLLVSLINGIVQALPQLAQMTPRIILTTVNVLRQNLPQILAAGKQILTSLISGISSMFGNLRTKAGEIFTTVKNKLAELPGALVNIGKDLVRGLWNGINDMTSWVINKIQGFGDSVLNGIRNFFGINSPSKLFEDEVGVYLAQGIGAGFSDEMANVTKEMQNAIPQKFNVDSDLTGINAGATGGIDFNTLVAAFRDALEGVTVEMDDHEMGRFVRTTVTNAIYS